MKTTEEKPRERPILFSGPMVRALIAGAKTQTRRTIKAKNMVIRGTDGIWYDADCVNPGVPMKCPFSQKGERLWVRETHRFQDGMTAACQHKDEVEYRADGDRPKEPTDCHWRPSIFMPRWASRLTLEITDVRVERLNEISEEDARAEGAIQWWLESERTRLPDSTAKAAFQQLWESINGPGSWAKNPWIWALSFRVLTEKGARP